MPRMTSEHVGQSSTSTLLLFGDSIANGLGVRQGRYGALLSERLGMALLDRSKSGATIVDTIEEFVADPPPGGGIAIIAHGVTESIYRPTPHAVRFLPRRWRRRGWMDPRPYYSRRLRKRIAERLESAVRWRVKVLLLARKRNAHRLVSPSDYCASVLHLVQLLRAQNTTCIVLGPPDLDDRYFPGSPASQLEYMQELRLVGIDVLDVRTTLDRWDDYFMDHFHPNERGHQKIAELLEARIKVGTPGTVIAPDRNVPGQP